MLYILLMSNAKIAKWKDALSAVSPTKPLWIFNIEKNVINMQKLRHSSNNLEALLAILENLIALKRKWSDNIYPGKIWK